MFYGNAEHCEMSPQYKHYGSLPATAIQHNTIVALYLSLPSVNHCWCVVVQVFWAFMLDLVMFYIWQLSFMQAAPAKFRYVPYFGLAGWLISGGTKQDKH